MSFANHNILDIALSIIPPTLVQVRKNLSTTDNSFGQVTAAYSEWMDVYGIVQPGSESNEHVNGIDFSKKYVTIWLRSVTLTGTHLQEAPDQIKYMGRIYNVIDVDDWYPYDNYRKCECVEVVNNGTEDTSTDTQPTPDQSSADSSAVDITDSSSSDEQQTTPAPAPVPPPKIRI